MKSINETDLQSRFSEILDTAQQQPIVIRREGKDMAAIVSIADYERLRLANIRSFFDLRQEVAREATTSGLTEEGLAELLSDLDP